jgi:hypothetical protein
MVARVFGCRTGCDINWADYLRDEAAKYRQLAEASEDLSIKQELLELVAVCTDLHRVSIYNSWDAKNFIRVSVP